MQSGKRGNLKREISLESQQTFLEWETKTLHQQKVGKCLSSATALIGSIGLCPPVTCMQM